MRRVRLAILGSHPIHYRVPLYRRLVEDPDVETHVFYGDTHGVTPRTSRWGIPDFTWDMPLTEGYPHTFVTNRARRPGPSHFFGKVNPGLWPAVRRFEPDAVLVSGYAGVYELQGLVGSALQRLPLLYTADTSVLGDRLGIHGERPALRRAVRDAWLRGLYRGVDAFLVPGANAAEHYRAHGVADDRLVRFPLTVDNDHYRAEAERLAPRRAELRAKFGIASDACCVLTVGELAPWKNVGELLTAAERIPHVHVLVVGSGAGASALRAQAESRLAGRATFTGFLNLRDVPEAYAAADVFALTSRFEAWGLVVNEAMSFGLPLVLSDRVGAARDVVRPGFTGEIYSSGDVDALVRALHDVIERRPRSGRAASEMLREDVLRFSFSEQQAGVRAALRRVGLPVEYRPPFDDRLGAPEPDLGSLSARRGT